VELIKNFQLKEKNEHRLQTWMFLSIWMPSRRATLARINCRVL